MRILPTDGRLLGVQGGVLLPTSGPLFPSANVLLPPGGGGGGEEGLPTEGLVLYLDGEDLGAVGDPIAAWTGRVGGDDATQSNGGNRPAVVDWDGELKAAVFAGADYLTTSIVPATGAGGRTLLAVVRNAGVSGSSYDHVLQYGTLDTQRAYGLTSVTALFSYWGNDRYNGFMRSTDTVDTGAHVLVVAYDGTTDRLWRDGTLIVSETIALDTGSTHGLKLGGRADGLAEFAQVEIAAVAAYDTFLDEETRDAAVTFLAERFGITL